MWTWLSRMFRSSSAAERAEAEGRVDAAARLYVESGDRPEAVRVLLRAGETARTLDERRGYLTRAYGLARSPELRDAARRALAMVALAEAEAAAPRTPEARRMLVEAAADLEALGAYAEAVTAYEILEDREAVVRVLTLAGDVESLERETGATALEERLELRRRAALESFDARWRSGDRQLAVTELRQWAEAHPDDHEVRRALDTRAAWLIRGPSFEVEVDGGRYVLAGRFPLVLGREGDVVVRGGSVSRKHCTLRREGRVLSVEDAGSRAGTSIDRIQLAGALPLVVGRCIELGNDLALRVLRDEDLDVWILETDKGLDRGRRLLLLADGWNSPLGRVHFTEGGPVLAPTGPVSLNGQKVAVPLTLCRGDTVEGAGHTLTVLR